MFYIRDSTEAIEAQALELDFQKSLPYFATPDFGETTHLQVVEGLSWSRQEDSYLVFDPETALWCHLDGSELPLYEALKAGTSYADLLRRFPQHPRVPMAVFLTHLYRRGLLALDGKPGLDRNLYADGPLFRKAYLVELLLTEKCNLACTYCFAEAGPRRLTMSPEVAHRTVDKAMELPTDFVRIEFAGGETLVEFAAFCETVEYLEAAAQRAGKEVQILVQSNGTRFTDPEVVQFVKEHRIWVGVSLDGPPEIHNRTRVSPDGRGSYERVLAGIRRLQEAGLEEVPVLTVVNGYSVEHPREIIDHFLSLGIHHTLFNRPLPLGRGDGAWAEVGVTPQQYFEFMREVLEYGAPRGLLDMNVGRMLQNLMVRTRSFRCMRSPCGAGFDYLVIDPRGNVYPCAHHVQRPELRLGNIFDPEPLHLYVMKNRLIAEMRLYRTVHNIPECRQCLWRHLCTGGCSLDTYIATGSLYHPEPFCEFYRQYYPFLLGFVRRRPDLFQCYFPEAEAVEL
jgi:uncharacterized protein